MAAVDVNKIMQSVMKVASKIAAERPDFGLDPNLPLCRATHPEWFEDVKPN